MDLLTFLSSFWKGEVGAGSCQGKIHLADSVQNRLLSKFCPWVPGVFRKSSWVSTGSPTYLKVESGMSQRHNWVWMMEYDGYFIFFLHFVAGFAAFLVPKSRDANALWHLGTSLDRSLGFGVPVLVQPCRGNTHTGVLTGQIFEGTANSQAANFGR